MGIFDRKSFNTNSNGNFIEGLKNELQKAINQDVLYINEDDTLDEDDYESSNCGSDYDG